MQHDRTGLRSDDGPDHAGGRLGTFDPISSLGVARTPPDADREAL